MTDFWRAFYHDGNISPCWWGWGVHDHPISLYLPSRTKLQCTHAPAKRTETLLLLYLSLYVLCGSNLIAIAEQMEDLSPELICGLEFQHDDSCGIQPVPVRSRTSYWAPHIIKRFYSGPSRWWCPPRDCVLKALHGSCRSPEAVRHEQEISNAGQ
jgi:hypothetical protein